MSEIYGSSGGYDSGSDGGNAYDPWDNYDPDAELEAMGITRTSEWERMRAGERRDAGYGDDQADDDYDTDLDAANYAAGNDPETAWRNQGNPDSPNGLGCQGGDDSASKPHDDPVEGHDADIEAILGENDHLPEPRTRQEAAADAWDRPDQTPGETLTQNRNADQTARGQHPYRAAEHDKTSEQASHDDGDASAADQAADTDDALHQRLADLESANAELKTENTQLSRGMAELETGNADLGKRIAEVEARNDTLEARLERLEQKADDPALAAMRNSGQDAQTVAEEAKKQQPDRPEWRSNEAVGLAAAVSGGIVTTIADYWSALPATYAGIAASALGIGAATVGWYRKHREVKDAHRPGH